MKGYIKGLDGLRAIAVILVIAGHLTTFLKWQADSIAGKLLIFLAHSSWIGVQLFFVISGYLITRILINSRDEPYQISNFYIRRSLRIFPLYYLFLVIYLIILPLVGTLPENLSVASDNQWLFWSYLNNWTFPFHKYGQFVHLWSLAVEEQFYLFWPFIIAFLSNRKILYLCFIMILSAILLRALFVYMPDVFGMSFEEGKKAAYFFTVARWDSIAIGAILAFIMQQPSYKSILAKYTKPVLAVLSVFIIAQIIVNHNFTSADQGIGFLNQTSIAIVLCLVLFLVIDSEKSLWTNLLESRWVKEIGKVSYAMYLFHMPLLSTSIASINSLLSSVPKSLQFLSVIGLNIAFLLVVFLLAKISWHFFEHPLLKLKSKLTIRPKNYPVKDAVLNSAR